MSSFLGLINGAFQPYRPFEAYVQGDIDRSKTASGDSALTGGFALDCGPEKKWLLEPNHSLPP